MRSPLRQLCALAIGLAVLTLSACSPAGEQHFETLGNAICKSTARTIASQASLVEQGKNQGDAAGTLTVNLLRAMESERKAFAGLTPPAQYRVAWEQLDAYYTLVGGSVEKRLTGKALDNDILHRDHVEQYRLTMRAMGLEACAERGQPWPGQGSPIGNNGVDPRPGAPIPEGTKLLPGVIIEGYETAEPPTKR